jgi:hypothetical protein
MGSATNSNHTKDFVILGPAFIPGSHVLEAVHSLYFLPENFKLVFLHALSANKDLLAQVTALVARDELGERVQFVGQAARTHAVILPHPHKSRSKHSVTGDSPEALASAILNVARATA